MLPDGFPRRHSLPHCKPAELAIRKAIDEVELLGADEKLTEIITELNDTLEKLSDFIDSN